MVRVLWGRNATLLYTPLLGRSTGHHRITVHCILTHLPLSTVHVLLLLIPATEAPTAVRTYVLCPPIYLVSLHRRKVANNTTCICVCRYIHGDTQNSGAIHAPVVRCGIRAASTRLTGGRDHYPLLCGECVALAEAQLRLVKRDTHRGAVLAAL